MPSSQANSSFYASTRSTLSPEAAGLRAVVPSNIAFIKYWGKRDEISQWPANDSLSMTLSAAHTVTEARLSDGPCDQLVRNGTLVSPDGKDDKALRHISLLRERLGFKSPLAISTRNTFPADCGIASSASGLGALTLAAVAAWTGAESLEHLVDLGFPIQRLAHLARLGSGSACRSLLGGYVEWRSGAHSDDQSIKAVASPEDFPLSDVIVLLSKAAKPVSSTAAHRHAWTSPLFAPRLAGLSKRHNEVRQAIAARDIERLGDAIEAEALEMHAVMMSSTPPAFYMTSETSRLLAWVRDERSRGGLEAWFTVDAGPNVHLICRPQVAQEVAHRIMHDFGAPELLVDQVGHGPRLGKGLMP
jgi:diphosphomevalonate decarboxylase